MKQKILRFAYFLSVAGWAVAGAVVFFDLLFTFSISAQVMRNVIAPVFITSFVTWMSFELHFKKYLKEQNGSGVIE